MFSCNNFVEISTVPECRKPWKESITLKSSTLSATCLFPNCWKCPTKPGLLQLFLLTFDLSSKGNRKKSPVFNECFGWLVARIETPRIIYIILGLGKYCNTYMYAPHTRVPCFHMNYPSIGKFTSANYEFFLRMILFYATVAVVSRYRNSMEVAS